MSTRNLTLAERRVFRERLDDELPDRGNYIGGIYDRWGDEDEITLDGQFSLGELETIVRLWKELAT